MVLLRGLSPNAATVVKLSAKGSIGDRRPKVNTVEGPKAAQAAFDAILKPPPAPVG